MADYCSLDDVKNYLMGIDRTTLTELDDAYITSLIEMTTSEINDYCKQSLASETTKVAMFGLKESDIILPYLPVTKIENAVMLSGLSISYTFVALRYVNCTRNGISLATPTPTADLENGDLIIDVVAGSLHIPWEVDMITSTYGFRADVTHGFPTIPNDLKFVATRLVAGEILELKGDQLSGGTSSKAVDGYKVDFKGLPFGDRLARSDIKAKKVLDSYKLLSI